MAKEKVYISSASHLEGVEPNLFVVYFSGSYQSEIIKENQRGNPLKLTAPKKFLSLCFIRNRKTSGEAFPWK